MSVESTSFASWFTELYLDAEEYLTKFEFTQEHIVPIIVIFMLFTVVNTLTFSIFIDLGYGRYTNTKSTTIPAFVAWMLMEVPAIAFFWINILLGLDIITSSGTIQWSLLTIDTFLSLDIIQKLGIIMFSIHYIFRGFIYPFLGHNPLSPFELYIASLGAYFCSLNGSILAFELIFGTEKAISMLPFKLQQFIHQYTYFGYEGSIEYESSISIYSRYAGVIIFAVGWIINQHSDAILRNLRKNVPITGKGEDLRKIIENDNELSKDSFVNASGRLYRIPRGGIFEYVSSANYFGEILEWIGFCITLRTFTAYIFLLGTVANLVPRAIQHHKFYRDNMPTYPRNRKAVIPFIL